MQSPLNNQSRSNDSSNRDDPLNGADAEFAAALGNLAPLGAGHSLEEIAFEAGRVAGHRASRRATIALGGISTALAAGLAIAVFLRPAPRTVDRFVYLRATPQNFTASAIESSAKSESQFLPASYMTIRDQYLAAGVDALPITGGGTDRPVPQAMEIQPYKFHLPSLPGGNS